MPELSAQLILSYRVDATGAIVVKQTLRTAAAEPDKMPHLMRFGMELTLPGSFEQIHYYGRGPIENYADRAEAALVGRYRSTVAEAYYPYIRPQESGNHTGVRWWRQCDRAGRGFEVRGDSLLSLSALPYRTSDLDDGTQKGQRHSGELTPRNEVSLHIDHAQMGLGCVNSWGAWPQAVYMLPYGDYSFRFVLRPVEHDLD